MWLVGSIPQSVGVAIAGPHTGRTAPSCIRSSPAQRLRDVVDPQEIQTVAHHSEGRGLLATRHQPTSPALRPLGLARVRSGLLPSGPPACPTPTPAATWRRGCPRTSSGTDSPSDWTSRSPRHLPHTRYTNGAVTGVRWQPMVGARSTTHRCHTCCLRIHATAFRTLQDAEPRDHPAGDMNLFGCCSVACATKHTAPSRHDTISK
jgi:hypothetical protein